MVKKDKYCQDCGAGCYQNAFGDWISPNCGILEACDHEDEVNGVLEKMW